MCGNAYEQYHMSSDIAYHNVKTCDDTDSCIRPETTGTKCGRCCCWLCWETIDLSIFAAMFLTLYFTVAWCTTCVFVIGCISSVLCFRWKIFMIIFYASFISLLFHGWNVTGNKVSIVWG